MSQISVREKRSLPWIIGTAAHYEALLLSRPITTVLLPKAEEFVFQPSQQSMILPAANSGEGVIELIEQALEG